MCEKGLRERVHEKKTSENLGKIAFSNLGELRN